MDRLASLTVFGRVVECGGFSAAARRLNMSVTMVGKHVQSLEEQLGVRLLNRTTRKVSLTETGKFYYDRSTQILAELEETDRAASALSLTPRGTLRVYSGVYLIRFLSPIISEYLELYPSVTLNLEVGERMVDLVEDGYDLAIRTMLPPDGSFIARSLTHWRHILCCAPEYLDSHPTPLEPADLVGHNCLRYAYYPFGDDWRFFNQSGDQVNVKITGNIVTTSAEALRYMTLNAQGIFLAPSFVVSEELASGALVRLMPDYGSTEFSINAIYPNRSHLPTRTRLFIDLIAGRFLQNKQWML